MKFRNRFLTAIVAFAICLFCNFSIFADVGKVNVKTETQTVEKAITALPLASGRVKIAAYGSAFYYADLRRAGRATIAFEPKIIKKYGVRTRIFQPPEKSNE